MSALLSMVLFLMPVWTGQGASGTVGGTIRDSAGKPQSGVRVAAMAVQSAGTSNNPEVLVSIGKTDESGAYVLEIPPGRYYIVTGRVDRPTYYPDANTPDRATVFSITAGSSMKGIDFLFLALVGTVRDAAGNPQVGVPVVAIASSTTRCNDLLSNSTKTDNGGVYRLEVTAGEYFVVIPLGNRTIFYPRAETRENATLVAIKNGTAASGLDIVVPSNRAFRAGLDFELFAKGVELARIGCHSPARLMFQTLLTTYPDSEYASDAKYESAESYYREGSPVAFRNAKKEFTEYILYFPTAPRLSEARQRLLEIERN